MKQKTLQFALEWSSRTQDSFLVIPSHSYSMNAATTVKECQRRASTGWQCNQERARRISSAQAGTACIVFSLWSATNAVPAKQEWHGRGDVSLEQYMLLNARLSVERLVPSPVNPQDSTKEGLVFDFFLVLVFSLMGPKFQFRNRKVENSQSLGKHRSDPQKAHPCA